MGSEFDIYLASQSPRRRELLEQIGVRFELLPVDVAEVPLEDELAEDFVQRVALDKARAGFEQLAEDDPHSVLGADTAVVVDGEILGKPRDRSHAKAMLSRLSGRSHQVMSAVALVGAGKQRVLLNISEVSFADLSDDEVDAYIASNEGQDKAGSYAVQGAAAIFIPHISGSYSGVMGLPLYETAKILHEFGIIPLKRMVS